MQEVVDHSAWLLVTMAASKQTAATNVVRHLLGETSLSWTPMFLCLLHLSESNRGSKRMKRRTSPIQSADPSLVYV